MADDGNWDHFLLWTQNLCSELSIKARLYFPAKDCMSVFHHELKTVQLSFKKSAMLITFSQPSNHSGHPTCTKTEQWRRSYIWFEYSCLYLMEFPNYSNISMNFEEHFVHSGSTRLSGKHPFWHQSAIRLGILNQSDHTLIQNMKSLVENDSHIIPKFYRNLQYSNLGNILP